MNWKLKAKVMQVCAKAHAPGLYVFIQQYLGRLRPDPWRRLPIVAEMLKDLLSMGFSIKDKVVFEVGTGHNPVIPIGLWLCGASKVVTMDLHRRLNWKLLRKTLHLMVSSEKYMKQVLSPTVVDPLLLSERMALLSALADNPTQLLKQAGIVCLSPADAACTGLSDNSVDLHISCTVFEHIPADVIRKIMIEARRIISPAGVAYHRIDLSDHFSHTDKNITLGNFLKFSAEEWEELAGNEYAYCNRLRCPEYQRVFKETGWQPVVWKTAVDRGTMDALDNKELSVHEDFMRYSKNELATMSIIGAWIPSVSKI